MTKHEVGEFAGMGFLARTNVRVWQPHGMCAVKCMLTVISFLLGFPAAQGPESCVVQEVSAASAPD